MKSINLLHGNGLERLIIEQETNPVNYATARRALESALVLQFRALAQGLLGDLLLRGQAIDELGWWQQYLSTLDTPDQYFPNLRDPTFLTFRQQLINSIAIGRVHRITKPMLNSISIRVYGGYVKFWEEGRINRQLASLGSSHRLVVVGSEQLRLSRLQRFLAKEPTASSQADGRFLFGQVAPITVSSKAATLFDFEREFAVSPYVLSQAEGFQEGARIIIRQTILRIGIELSIQKGEADRSNYERMLRSSRMFVKIEEDNHKAFDLLLSNFASQLSERQGHQAFRSVIKEDICRFAQQPRSINEIVRVIEDVLYCRIGEESQRSQIEAAVNKLIERMLDEKLVSLTADGKIKCSLYDEGKAWNLI